jgi:hypothetical protein
MHGCNVNVAPTTTLYFRLRRDEQFAARVFLPHVRIASGGFRQCALPIDYRNDLTVLAMRVVDAHY